MSVEERVMLGMFGALPPPSVHNDMVSALQEMCLAAAKTVYDERYIGPTEKQLDDIAEAAALRISTDNHVTWKVEDSIEGTKQLTPFRVVKMQQKFIKRNTAGRKKLEEQVALMRQELKDLRKHCNWVEDENMVMQRNFTELVVSLTTLDLKREQCDKRIKALEDDKRIKALEESMTSLDQEFRMAISRLAIRSRKQSA